MASPSLAELHFVGNCVMPLMTGSRVWANIASLKSARSGMDHTQTQTINGNKNEHQEVFNYQKEIYLSILQI